MSRHTNFNAAYTHGLAFRLDGKDPLMGRVEVVEVGDVLLPSGKIIACDPSYLYEDIIDTAFEMSVPPGSYPVSLSIARFNTPEYGMRIACAKIQFRSLYVNYSQLPLPAVDGEGPGGWGLGIASIAEVAISWQMATRPGQNIATLPFDHIFCYGVDAGLGCFMDHQTAFRHVPSMVEDHLAYYKDGILKALYPTQGQWGIQSFEGGMNICIFHSGWGDGCYASYWGLDAGGNVVCLVTDFGIYDFE